MTRAKAVSVGARKRASPRAKKQAERAEWELRLYVAGTTPRSIAALENLKAACEASVPGRYTIRVIDLMKHPQLARDDRIVAVPTVVRALPEPMRRMIGDLSNKERVLVGLDLRNVARAARV